MLESPDLLLRLATLRWLSEAYDTLKVRPVIVLRQYDCVRNSRDGPGEAIFGLFPVSILYVLRYYTLSIV